MNFKNCSSVEEMIVANGRSPNSYDIEHMAPYVADILRHRLKSCADGPEKSFLAELLAFTLLLGGVAADGSRTAYNLAPDNSGR